MPDIIRYELIGFRDTQGRFRRMSREVQDELRKFAREAGRELVKYLKKYAPVGTHYIIQDSTVMVVRPETLKKSIKFRTFRKSYGIELVFYAARHAKFVIEGTKPHIIRAKRAKFLRFYWPNAPAAVTEMFPDNIVFFKQVSHPGTKPNPFNERALFAAEPELRTLLRRRTRKIREKILGVHY